MTDTKWTPGPWAAEASYGEDGNPYWCEDLGGEVWCVASPYTSDTATWIVDAIREANAHLIAAAPDLYENAVAARDTMERAAMMFETLNMQDEAQRLRNGVAVCEHLIKRARGEEGRSL